MYVEVRRMNTIPIGIDGILANFGHLATRPLSRDSRHTRQTKQKQLLSLNTQVQPAISDSAKCCTSSGCC
jgi:hypothetical protein